MADLNLKSIRFSDFKGFVGEHVLKLDQRPGLYHISGSNKLFPELGANGVGKSTIWDLLIWVLFAKTGRDNKPGSSIAPWSGGSHTQGELKFQRGDGPEICLVRRRNPNALELYEEDGPRAISQDEVPKLLGMSEEMFRRTMILGQFGTLFLDLESSKQAQMFSEALDLDGWLGAATRASSAATLAKAEINDYSSEVRALETLIADLTEQMDAADKRADLFQDSIEHQAEDLTTKLGVVQNGLKLAREALGDRPELPKQSKRMVEILDSLDGEADYVRKLMQSAHRKAGPAKRCKTCDQVIVNDALAATLKEIDEQSVAQIKTLHAGLKAEQEKRAKLDQFYQRQMDDYRKQKDIVDDLARTADALQKKIKELDGATNEADEEYKRLKSRKVLKKAALLIATRNLEAAQVSQKQAEFWVKGFKEIRLGIIDEVLTELEIAASRHAELLGLTDWLIRFETEREAKSGNVSYSFTTLLFPPDQNDPIKFESYSGGESQRLQLAIAFGLSEVLLSRAGVDPNIEVLDEPTRGLSPEGITDLLDHLRTRALDLDRAIYLVDHHALDRGAFDGTLLVQKTAKGSTFRWL